MANYSQRDIRLDFAKAIAISFVLFLHLKPIMFFQDDRLILIKKIFGLALTFFYFQICLIAVPLFILVSLYIFYQKLERFKINIMEITYRRCLQLSAVYFFWTSCQFLFLYLAAFIISNIRLPHELSLNEIIVLIIHGGPDLPIVGGSVFYFLSTLLFLHVLSVFFYLLRSIDVLFYSIGTAIIVISIIFFQFLNLNRIPMLTTRMENYIIYIPLSYFILKQEERKLIHFIPYFYIGFVGFSVQDFFLGDLGGNYSPYSRASIIFGSVALFSSILKLKEMKRNFLITFLSKYSLGIFATHKYWQLIVIIIFNYLNFSILKNGTGNCPISLHYFITAIVSVLLTVSGVLLARNTFLKRFFSGSSGK